MEFIILPWFLLSIAVGILASNRGRFGLGWFLFSIILSPVLGFIFVLVVKDLAATQTIIVQAPEAPDEFTPDGAYMGHPELSNDSYTIYLTKRYGIGKNDILDKYVIGGKLFPDIDSAIDFAHAQELAWIEKRAKELEYDLQRKKKVPSYQLGVVVKKYPFLTWVCVAMLIGITYSVLGGKWN